MPDWVSFWAELRAVVASTWPEVVASANPIHRTVAIQKIDWESLNFPCAILEAERAPATDEYGLTNLAYVLPVKIHYVADDATNVEETIDTKLASLQTALYAASFTNGQLQDVMGHDVSAENPVNERLIEFLLPYTAGTLEVEFLLGDTLV